MATVGPMAPRLHVRNGIYHLIRRVPKRYASVESRKMIWISLKTDSLSLAEDRADKAWDEMLAAWDALLMGDTEAYEMQLAMAKRAAQSMGFRYLPVNKVAELPFDDMIARIEAAMKPDGTLDRRKARITLGGVLPPALTLSQTLEVFLQHTKDQQATKNRNQLRIWRNTRKAAMAALIDAITDLRLEDVSQNDLLDFREAMWKRIEAGDISRNTANKQIGTALHILNTVATARRMDLSFSGRGLRFSDAEAGQREPFSDNWIRTKILAPGALDGLNVEARCILLGMINTGYRPGEAAELRAEDIRLDTEIPHIDINSRHRKLKTKQSERIIPLVGVSLEAFRSCPDGFPRYRDSASLTTTINKYMREHGLRETPRHTLYGLRHSMEDRLLAADVDERIRRDVLGHKLMNRERYGAGARLDKLHRILKRIAI